MNYWGGAIVKVPLPVGCVKYKTQDVVFASQVPVFSVQSRQDAPKMGQTAVERGRRRLLARVCLGYPQHYFHLIGCSCTVQWITGNEIAVRCVTGALARSLSVIAAPPPTRRSLKDVKSHPTRLRPRTGIAADSWTERISKLAQGTWPGVLSMLCGSCRDRPGTRSACRPGSASACCHLQRVCCRWDCPRCGC